MVDWTSPEQIQSNALSFSKFVHVLLGLYIWEWVTSVDFDLTFISGKRKFRWPMLFYFYGRYGMLGGLIGFVIILDTQKEINCQAAYIVLQILGNTSLGVASINLSLRTIAIWSNSRYIIIPIVALIIGHFVIIIRSIFNASSHWVDGAGCVTQNVQSTVFAAMYIYTMIFDFIIMLLSAYKLWFNNRRQHRTKMVRLLFQDGLIYFMVAFVGNTVAVVFSILDLNPVMSLIADIPATTFATIAAGRVVRRLSNYMQKGPELYSNSSRGPSGGVTIPSARGGVRVEMTTFTDGNDDNFGSGSSPNQDSKIPADSEIGLPQNSQYGSKGAAF